MQDLEMKQKILSEIMGLMDDKEGERLKMHPKLIAAKLEVGKPEDKVLEASEDESPEEEKAESPEAEKLEGEDLSPEMIQKLLEMYKDQE